ncbi:MAG: SpoIIE family protein phosphatase, partial [Christensenellaceae bacterium]|nr:SpoIIE family protein phosphatase [Christensenellaceae bacterium]
MHTIIEDKEYLSTVIDAMGDLVRVVDRNGRVVFTNRAHAYYLGSHVNDSCFECWQAGESCQDCLRHKVMASGQIMASQRILKGRTFSLKSAPICGEDGRVNAVVEVMRDVTAQEETRQRLMSANSKMQADLSMARQLQHAMMNRKLPLVEGWSFESGFYPCEAVGGDAFGVLPLPDGRVLLYVGDVSGHGVRAAMLTVFLRQEVASWCRRGVDLTLPALAEQLSSGFMELNTEESVYITAFFAMMDPQQGTIEMMNAGSSIAPLLKSGKQVSEVILPGSPICRWADPAGGTCCKVDFAPGDRLLLYSDGISKTGMAEDWLWEDVKDMSIPGDKLIEKCRTGRKDPPDDDLVVLLV